MKTAQAPGRNASVKCAVYCRKSTSEGLDSDFSSIDAQREACEAYITSQRNEGWQCLPAHYDDGGFTGANTDRPALQRILADVEAGRVNAVVVYKIDRLSRSLLDFAKLLELFEKKNVALVSITQQFNTATSLGKLVLNMLMSFAEFERSLISERTRDKIALSRQRGKWAGGQPLLGYDVGENKKLQVNEAEAAQIRQFFDLYLQHEALLPVVQELERRGWKNKTWTTRKGEQRGGHPFVKTNLHRLLTNPAYAGKVRHKEKVYEGEHKAIVASEIWQRVQEILTRNGQTGGGKVRNKYGAILKGLLRCTPCGCAMSSTHTSKGSRRFRYYQCTNSQKRGRAACPSRSIPAGQIEQFVLDRIRVIGQDPSLWRETFHQAREQAQESIQALEVERSALGRDLGHWNGDVTNVATQNGHAERLADLHERIRTATNRIEAIQVQLTGLRMSLVPEMEVTDALAKFDPVWENLTPHEQVRLVDLLVERVEFDGTKGKVAITFHASGIQSLASELNQKESA